MMPSKLLTVAIHMWGIFFDLEQFTLYGRDQTKFRGTIYASASKFSYRNLDTGENGFYGPKLWENVGEEGWTYDWSQHPGLNITRNECRNCSSGKTCSRHKQSPINLWWIPSKNCKDNHEIFTFKGTCDWDDLEFTINPNSLRAEFKRKDDKKCKLPSIDLPNGFPSLFKNIFMEIKMPSEHTVHGKRLAGELVLTHYGTLSRDHWMANLALFLDVDENTPDNPLIERYIEEWEETFYSENEECFVPTDYPTHYPTEAPTEKPTKNPTSSPTFTPKPTFTASPTSKPTITGKPTKIPTMAPTVLEDITSPGDYVEIVMGRNDDDSRSGPPKVNEKVSNVIDNTGRKYLNYNDLGSGFIVTPQIGSSIIYGARFYPANDKEKRDPSSYLIEGATSDDEGNRTWETISSGIIKIPRERIDDELLVPLNPEDHPHYEVKFKNNNAYSTYRVTFPTLKNSRDQYAMQIAEVDLLGNRMSRTRPNDRVMPTENPSLEPSENPTQYPVKVPTKKPSDSPTSKTPTDMPTNAAVKFRTRSPTDTPTRGLMKPETGRVITSPTDYIEIVYGDNDNDNRTGGPKPHEDVRNAIDGTGKKYLNYNDLGSGFIVTPNIGKTIVEGIRLYPADDRPARDPSSYLIERAAIDEFGQLKWDYISDGTILLPYAKRISDEDKGPLNPENYPHAEISFENTKVAYTYRVTFPTLRNSRSAHSMQIAEVELLGFPVNGIRTSNPTTSPISFSSQTNGPTNTPVALPTFLPTFSPTLRTSLPSGLPSFSPSVSPTSVPTFLPTLSPTLRTSLPSSSPSLSPTSIPSSSPIYISRSNPTIRKPTLAPVQILYDVTSPKDDIKIYFGKDDNDGREGPPKPHEVATNVLDNSGKEYLNYNDLGSGFTVEVLDKCVIKGARFYPANDREGRDPSSYKIEGGRRRKNGRWRWSTIKSGTIRLPAARIKVTEPKLDPRFPHAEILFENQREFQMYRVTFPTLKDSDSEHSMQIAEVELLGYFTGGGVSLEGVRTTPISSSSLIAESSNPVSQKKRFKSTGTDRAENLQHSFEEKGPNYLLDLTTQYDMVGILKMNGVFKPDHPRYKKLTDKTGAGFISRVKNDALVIKPAIGKTVIRGARFYTSDSEEKYDPSSFVIDGGVEEANGEITWRRIRAGVLNMPSARVDRKTQNIDPELHPHDGVWFNNDEVYDMYRMTFPETKDNSVNYEMRISEIELVGYRSTRKLEESNFNIYDLITTIYFWRYEGSLTVPPCSENVQWRIFDRPIRISPRQQATLEWLIRAYRDPDTCQRATVGRPRRDGTGNVDVVRPTQAIKYDHLQVHCTSANY